MHVQLRNISKYFGALQALNNVTLGIRHGSIHGILGENGAGKSTLMKILSGFISADRGEIHINGQVVRLVSPAQAVAAGVGMLFQDPLDFPALTVLENFVLGNSARLIPNRSQARRNLLEIAGQFDFSLDPDAYVSELSIGQRQQLEIVRLLSLGVNILILDEPTTAISAQQREKLFTALRKLTNLDKSVIFVTHKLEEVMQLCDEVTVLNHGQVAGAMFPPFDQHRLVTMMFGQDIVMSENHPQPQPSTAPLLQLNNATVSDQRINLRDLQLSVIPGEIIGLAGLEGNGQQLLLQLCSGLRISTTGQILLNGIDLSRKRYHQFQRMGIALMPASRLEEGLIPGLTIAEHVAIVELQRHSVFVNRRNATRSAAGKISQYRIKGRPQSCAEELSGGNQQRLLLALLPSQLKLLLMEHPTRGLDVESSEYIWGLLMQRAQSGTAIIFISSDLEELLRRSHRLIVFSGGHMSTPHDTKDLTVEQLGTLIGSQTIS